MADKEKNTDGVKTTGTGKKADAAKDKKPKRGLRERFLIYPRIQKRDENSMVRQEDTVRSTLLVLVAIVVSAPLSAPRLFVSSGLRATN